EAGRMRFEPSAQKVLLEQFLPEPQRQSDAERGKTARREGKISLEQARELHQRLFVKNDVIQIVCRQAAFGETIAYGIFGVTLILLFAAEAFFLRGGDDVPLLDQRRRTVVIEGGDPENTHPPAPQPSFGE